MLRQQIRFEWHIVDENPFWERMRGGVAPEAVAANLLPNAEHRFAQRLLHILAVILVGIVALSSVARTPAERDRIRATAGIQAALAREQVREQGEANEPPPLLLSVQPVGDAALAQLRVYEPALGWRLSTPYRETRFYRPTENGWLRTMPDQAFWGAQYYLETDYLRIEYSARDAATVAAIATRLDAIYATLHESLGLDPPSSVEKLTTVIAPFSVNSRGVYGDHIEISSPLLSQIPEGLSDADYLVHRLTSRYLYQAVGRSDNEDYLESSSYRWRMMRRGLRSWLQTELVGQRWPWDQEAEDLLRRDYNWQEPMLLADITSWNGWQSLDRDNLLRNYAVAESVIAYAVDTYGRAHLPDLTDGFKRYGSWQELTGSVYGIGAEEFEAGWNQYLVEQYGPGSKPNSMGSIQE